MNSASLDKPRRRAVRKVSFLVVLLLVTLVYAATPLTAFACDGNQDNGDGGIAASDKQAIADLKKGKDAGEILTDVNGVLIKQPDKLLVGAKVKVKFDDGVSLDAQFIGNGQFRVTLPSGKKVICEPQPDGSGKVTEDVPPPAIANGNKQAAIDDLKSVFSSEKAGGGIQLLKIKDPRTLRRGQLFRIELIRSNLILNALFVGNKKFTINPKVAKLSASFIKNYTKVQVTFSGNEQIIVPIVPAAA